MTEPWTIIRSVAFDEDVYDREGKRIIGIVASQKAIAALDAAGFIIVAKADPDRTVIREAADALAIFTGHDTQPRLKSHYGEKWWEPINKVEKHLRAMLSR